MTKVSHCESLSFCCWHCVTQKLCSNLLHFNRQEHQNIPPHLPCCLKLCQDWGDLASLIFLLKEKSYSGGIPAELNVTFVWSFSAKPEGHRQDQSTVSDFMSICVCIPQSPGKYTKFVYCSVNSVSEDCLWVWELGNCSRSKKGGGRGKRRGGLSLIERSLLVCKTIRLWSKIIINWAKRYQWITKSFNL